MKPVRLSRHARLRAFQRGADEEEIAEAIRNGAREPAERGKWRARWQFDVRGQPAIGGKEYDRKTVEVIFADEPEAIVVVTVKVYYSLEEGDRPLRTESWHENPV